MSALLGEIKAGRLKPESDANRYRFGKLSLWLLGGSRGCEAPAVV